MGTVELVVQRSGGFERLFAVKRLRAELRDDVDAKAMFLEEARLAGLLRHPNAISVLDFGADDEGPYLVMEYVESISVAALLAARGERLLPAPLCVRIALDAARGLHAAHELIGTDGTALALVHRDVSPANVLIGFDGVARITDFGIAHAADRTQRTTTGWLKGKLRYMAPEQLRFEELDRRTDLFALGVVLFELLSGKRLYATADPAEAARRILLEPPPDLADHRDDAEPALVELLFELLAKNKDARPPTAREVATRLEDILASTPPEAGSRIDEFLERNFAEPRDEMRTRILAARAAVQTNARRRRIRPWLALGVVGSLAVLGGVGVMTRPSARATELHAEASPLPAPSATSPSEPARANEETSASTAPAPSARHDVRTAVPSATASPPPSRPSTPKAVRRTVHAASPSSGRTSGAAPLWETYD